MKHRSNFFAVVLILLLVLTLVAFTACDNKNNETDNAYDIPSDLNVGVTFFDGDATSVLGMVTKNTLTSAAQHVIDVQGTSYVAYKVTDLTDSFKDFPVIESVRFVTTDEKQYDVAMTSFGASYIAIGAEEDGAFKALADAPLFIIDKDGTADDNVIGAISKVYVNPVMDFAPSVIPQDERIDLDVITEMSEVTVYDGETVLFSFKKKDLAGLDQYLVTLTAENKQYVGFRFTDIAAAKGASLPDVVNEVKASTLSEAITSLDNAYVLVRKADDPEDNTLNNIPRFVFDYTTVTDMNSDVAKNVSSIIINPVATEDPQETSVAELTLAWDGLKLTATLDDIAGVTDDGTIVIETASTDAADVTALTVNGTAVTNLFSDNRVVTKSTNKDGDFYGYTLQDIVNCLGKINNKGEFKAADYDVSTVKFTVTDESGNETASTTTIAAANMADAYVINYLKDGTTRVYPAAGSNVQNVVKIILYTAAQ